MSPREEKIRAGAEEITHLGEFQFVLYFEPYFAQGPYGQNIAKHAFTIDRNHISHRMIRERYDTLEEADEALNHARDELAVHIAKIAFGLH